jgi:hypothetical protein
MPDKKFEIKILIGDKTIEPAAIGLEEFLSSKSKRASSSSRVIDLGSSQSRKINEEKAKGSAASSLLTP